LARYCSSFCQRGQTDLARSIENFTVSKWCSDRDFHILKERVELSAEVLQTMEGKATVRLCPNMGYTINQDEVQAVWRMMEALLAPL
jgi:hypothetical protein